MSERMINEHRREAEKGELRDEDLDGEGAEPAWSPDNQLPKEDPTLGNSRYTA